MWGGVWRVTQGLGRRASHLHPLAQPTPHLLRAQPGERDAARPQRRPALGIRQSVDAFPQDVLVVLLQPPQRGVDAEAEERVGAEGGEAHELADGEGGMVDA